MDGVDVARTGFFGRAKGGGGGWLWVCPWVGVIGASRVFGCRLKSVEASADATKWGLRIRLGIFVERRSVWWPREVGGPRQDLASHGRLAAASEQLVGLRCEGLLVEACARGFHEEPGVPPRPCLVSLDRSAPLVLASLAE